VMTSARRNYRPTPKPKDPGRGGPPIDPSAVTLRKGKGSAERGGSRGGTYWHIEADGRRVGYIFINLIADEDLGDHPSIQIHLNTSMRGRGIGTAAYRMASQESEYDAIYAHMRKSNLASIKAALGAGYEILELPSASQLTMVWHRAAT
jgi:RimJ/RimL family protein N-acetyltransferase